MPAAIQLTLPAFYFFPRFNRWSKSHGLTQFPRVASSVCHFETGLFAERCLMTVVGLIETFDGAMLYALETVIGHGESYHSSSLG